MRLLRAAALAAAAALSPAVLADGLPGQLGFALGFAKGEDHKNPDNCKSASDFVADLNLLKKETGSTTIRLYTTTDCDVLSTVLPALKQTGAKVVLGLWSKPDDHFEKEVTALEGALKEFPDQILGVTVGSEALYREEETGQSLADKIKRVKKLAGDKPVGFADSWNLFLHGDARPAIEASDLILANAFSYWQGQEFSNATASFFDDIMQALAHIQDVKRDTPFTFWVGETNWPTGGAVYKGKAKPSVENAAKYWKEAVCGIRKWGVNTFVFEAFDEPWKKNEKDNDVERYWGVFTVDGKKKYSTDC